MMREIINKLVVSIIFIGIAGNVHAAAVESYNDKDCKRADGYSTTLLEKVAEGIEVPAATVKYQGAFIGGPLGSCAGLFATPKGPYECALSAYSTDGGKSYFIGVPSAGMVAGMTNLCRKAK